MLAGRSLNVVNSATMSASARHPVCDAACCVAGTSLLLENGQNIAGGVFEPRYHGTSAAENSSFVRFEIGLVIDLKADTALRELVHRFVHIVHREIEDGEGCRSMVRLRVNQDRGAARKVQVQQAIRFRNLQPECPAIELL